MGGIEGGQGVREVEITDGWPGKGPFLSRSVTSRAKVHKLVSLFNSLEIVQPGDIMCPAHTPYPTVKIAFGTGATGRVVARAAVSTWTDLSWPITVAGWACGPIEFNVGGRNRNPLIGNVIAPIQRLLNVKLNRHQNVTRPQ